MSRLIEQVTIKGLRRTWVAVLDEPPEQISESAQRAEKALRKIG